MKPRVLIIELGLKNIEDFKINVKPKNAQLIYGSNFIKIVDIIYLENIHVVLISDFRGHKPTVGYINILKKRDPLYKVLVVSIYPEVNPEEKKIYLENNADGFFGNSDYESIETKIFQFCSSIQKEDRFINEWSQCTKKSIRFIKDHYQLSDGFIMNMSKSLNYAQSTIYHSVKKDTGKSVGEWLQELRVKGSMELLKSTNLSIEEISEFVGYKSTMGYIKAFKNQTDFSPAHYRKIYFY